MKNVCLHKVQYYETDRMDCVHHSNYIRWFEEARTFLMEEEGFGYDSMEKAGVMSPVLKASAEYKSMARYGETCAIETAITLYTGSRVSFSYVVRDRESGVVRCLGETWHCFLNGDGRPVNLKKYRPEFDAKISEYIERAGQKA